jgi:hypothetical protein
VKLHNTAVQNLIRIFTTYGGHREEHRLIRELSKINFDVYTQQTGNQVIVLKEDVNKAIKNK